MWLVHLKSRRGSENDFLGLNQRERELETILKYYKRGTIIAGDFNCHISDHEFKGLLNHVKSFHDYIKSGDDARVTHVGFYPDKSLNEFDYILVPKPIKSGGRILFKNDYGDILGFADSFDERSYQPSDHFPIWVKL